MEKWFIKSAREGYFIGECLGLGFFESSIENGECDSRENPVEFSSKEEAENYLNSWTGGKADCYVTDIPPRLELTEEEFLALYRFWG